MPSITVPDFLGLALSEIRVIRRGDIVQPTMQDTALAVCNEVLDGWNGISAAAFSRSFLSYTTVPNLSPHTIGPAGTFNVTIRPLKIVTASIIISGTSKSPLHVVNSTWWSDQAMAPTIVSDLPGTLYYEPTWPLGSIYFYPIINAAQTLELQTLHELAQVGIGDSLDLPQGYQRALRLTLAEELCPHFGQPLDPNLVRRAADARRQIFGNNARPSRMQTRQGGMPGGRGGTGGYDYRSGMIR